MIDEQSPEALAAQYDAIETSLKATIQKNDERFAEEIRNALPAKIKPCPDESQSGFQWLSRAALDGVAAVFRAAIHGRRDADRE